MNRRFEIEELVAQDPYRVVYRARDREADRQVAVRRLVPGGHGEGGLDEDEAEAFESAVASLAAVECDLLRRVVTWGVDPIDRMPFVVTEWLDGESLAAVRRRGVISETAGRKLAEQGLATQAALDSAGSGWRIDTSADAILVVGDNESFRFSFWVHPFPRQGGSTEVVEHLASLVAFAMGWEAPGSGSGALAAWVRSMRKRPAPAAEAARMLETSPPGMDEPASRATEQAPAAVARNRPGKPPAPLPSRSWLWVALASLTLIAGGAGWWLVKDKSNGEPGLTATRPGSPAAERVPGAAAAEGKGPRDRKAEVEALARKLSAAAINTKGDGGADAGRRFGPRDGPAIRERIGRSVTLVGVVLNVRESASGKTRYLEFSRDRGMDDVCGRFLVGGGKAPPMFALEPLLGRRIAIHGKADIEQGTGRVVVHLESRDQIEELAPGS